MGFGRKGLSAPPPRRQTSVKKSSETGLTPVEDSSSADPQELSTPALMEVANAFSDVSASHPEPWERLTSQEHSEENSSSTNNARSSIGPSEGVFSFPAPSQKRRVRQDIVQENKSAPQEGTATDNEAPKGAATDDEGAATDDEGAATENEAALDLSGAEENSDAPNATPDYQKAHVDATAACPADDVAAPQARRGAVESAESPQVTSGLPNAEASEDSQPVTKGKKATRKRQVTEPLKRQVLAPPPSFRSENESSDESQLDNTNKMSVKRAAVKPFKPRLAAPPVASIAKKSSDANAARPRLAAPPASNSKGGGKQTGGKEQPRLSTHLAASVSKKKIQEAGNEKQGKGKKRKGGKDSTEEPTKGGKKKAMKAKDPNAPKRPLSAYLIWSMEERKAPEYVGLSLGEVGKAMGAKWRDLDDATKVEFQGLAIERKEEYLEALAAYEATGPSHKPQQVVVNLAKKAKVKTAPKKAILKTANFKAPAPLPPLVPQDRVPLMDELTLTPRATAKMHLVVPKVGDEIAWIPEALLEMCDHEDHSASLKGILNQLTSLPELNSQIMSEPMDGTANSARVIAVGDFTPHVTGWKLLTLRSTPALSSDIDEEEGGEITIPYIDALHCSVEQHVIDLKHYLASLERTREDVQVTVRFAVEASPNQDKPTEIIWEGRIWNRISGASHFKSLNVIWYQEAVDSEARNVWVVDEEQTDNMVSPWSTFPSELHERWSAANPHLAQIRNARLDRLTLSMPEATPESILIDENLPQDDAEEFESELQLRVLKRLLSNEATRMFYYPVPDSERTYYRKVRKPICLSEIKARVEGNEYNDYLEMHKDCQRMVENALSFNHEDTSYFMLAQIMCKDLSIASDAIAAVAPNVLSQK